MTKGNVIFIRLSDEEERLKKQLEDLAWQNKTSLNKFLRQVLNLLAETKTCEECPLGLCKIRDVNEQNQTSSISDSISKTDGEPHKSTIRKCKKMEGETK